MSFASQLTLLYFGTYALNTAPAWFIARSFGARNLGFYSRASLIVGIPLTALSSGVTKVMFPLYGHFKSDAAKTRTLVTEAVVLITGVSWPLLAVAAGASSVIVDLLLGPQWHQAVTMLQLCALAACATLPCGILTSAAEGMGWMRMAAARQGVFLILIAASLGLAWLGAANTNGLLLSVALAQWVTYLITLQPFVRRGLLDGGLVARSSVVHGLAAAVIYGMTLACAEILRSAPLVIQIAAEGAIVLAAASVLLRGKKWFPATRILFARLVPEKRGRLLGRIAFGITR
jgi:O-antigen/teichoic acid export membrane protein